MKKTLFAIMAAIGLVSFFAASAFAATQSVIEVDLSKGTNRSIMADGTLDIMGVRGGKAYICVKTAKLNAVTKKGISYNVIYKDADDVFAHLKGAPDAGLYHTYEEMCEKLNNLSLAHPELLTMTSLGQSIEGREIIAVRLMTDPEKIVKTASPAASGKYSPLKNMTQFASLAPAGRGAEKTQVLIMGGHHAREWISVEQSLYILSHLVNNYKKDEAVTRLIESREIWFVPMVNPDGITYSQTNYKMWRKNRRDNGDGKFGVDLNRNYGYKWGGAGSSSNTDDDTYHGTSAFSEPEAAAVKSLCDSKNFVACLTYHSYSELVLHPWGHTYSTANDPVLNEISDTIGRLINYTSQQSSDLYITTGDTTDWLYGEKKCAAFTVELGQEFIPEEANIEKLCGRNLPGAMYLIEKSGKLVNPIIHTAKLSPSAPGDLGFSCEINRKFYPSLEIKTIELVTNSAGKETRTPFSKDGDVFHATLSDPGAPVDYFIELASAGGEKYRYPECFAYRFNPVPSKVLLIQDIRDPKEAALYEYYQKSLSAAGMASDVWPVAKYGNLPEALMKQYPLAIWYFGADSKGLLSEDELVMIEKYLNSGLNLIISGQDTGYSFKRDPEPLAKYLKAKFVKDNTLVFNIAGAGSLSDISFSLKGEEGAQNQTVPDEIDPLAGAKTILKYTAGRGAVSSGSAGIEVGAYPGKLIVLAFGVEGIGREFDRQALLRKIALPLISPAALASSIGRSGSAVSWELENRLLELFSAERYPASSIKTPALSGLRKKLSRGPALSFEK